MNLFMGIGRITKKPELRYTTNNVAIVSFTLAINRDTKNKQGEYETDFISCVAYNKTAELISKYLDKGSPIAIAGHIQTGTYEKDNKKIYTTDVIVEKVSFIGTKKETKKEEPTESKVEETNKTDPYEEMGKRIEIENENDLPF